MITNTGRLVNFITGINGVASGGQAIINMPTNVRFHSNTLQCQAVNYTGGVALATTKITGAGNNAATVTPTVVNGVVTAAVAVATGAGYVTGDTITFTDATGTGCVLTVTAAAGAITALAVTVGGTASATNPATLITSIKQIVNGVNVRDISPDSIIRICQANGYYPQLGELPLFYSEPWRNLLANAEATSWDMYGQSTFALQIAIAATASLPSISGVSEFDYFRNVTTGAGGKQTLSLQPIAQHQFGFNVAVGRNDINTIPFNFPISRLWFLGSTPGNISQVEIYQDKNKVLEATYEQLVEYYGGKGFTFSATESPNFINQNFTGTGTVNKALQKAYNAPAYFDAGYISDPDQRFWKALRCQSELIIRIYSNVAQAITVIAETLPGSYQA